MIPLNRYEAGEVIIREDNVGETAYVINQGQVEVSKELQGQKVHLATLGAGETFGEMSMIDEKPRSATVTAVSETLVCEIRRDDFFNSFQTDPKIALQLLKVLFERLREADARILELQKTSPQPALVPEVVPAMPRQEQLTVTLEGMTPRAAAALSVGDRIVGPIRLRPGSLELERMGARGLEEGRPGLNARERGTLLHRALMQLWGDLESHTRLVAMHDDELSDAVATGDLRGFRRVMVDQVHQNLAAVTGVDRTGRVEHGHAEAYGEPGAGMHEPDVAGRERDRQARPHQPAGARPQLHVLGGDQVRAGVARVGVRREGQVGVEPGHQHLDRRGARVVLLRHGGDPTPAPAPGRQPNSVRSTRPIGIRPEPPARSWNSRSDPRPSDSQRSRIRAISIAPVRYDDACVGHAQ